MTQETRHKIVTNNGFLPKCITSLPDLFTPKPKFALQRTRGGAAPHHPHPFSIEAARPRGRTMEAGKEPGVGTGDDDAKSS